MSFSIYNTSPFGFLLKISKNYPLVPPLIFFSSFFSEKTWHPYLDCKNEAMGLCGGPNNIKCCPIYGCEREDNNDKTSFGKCLPYP